MKVCRFRIRWTCLAGQLIFLVESFLHHTNHIRHHFTFHLQYLISFEQITLFAYQNLSILYYWQNFNFDWIPYMRKKFAVMQKCVIQVICLHFCIPTNYSPQWNFETQQQSLTQCIYLTIVPPRLDYHQWHVARHFQVKKKTCWSSLSMSIHR